MRAGLRRDDAVVFGPDRSFTINLAGTDEQAAVRVADCLRRTLENVRPAQLGSFFSLTASFGVAARQWGDSDETLDHRARRALAAALARGADHVVPASEIEEIYLLPPPTTQPAASAT
jgi:GGDEF domain-containing protein